jgi:MazG family protein
MTDAEMIDPAAGTSEMKRLQAIMHRLRAPGGCPWDAEQTHESIVSNLIEETYETIDAIQRADFPHLREELGDVLLQVVFHSEIAEEAGVFNFEQVAHGICEKLIRRHPHVFANRTAATTSEAVLRQWDEIKRAEKGDPPEPYLHRVGHGLAGLIRAAKLQKKAAKIGFDWPSEVGVIAKIHEELAELETAIDAQDAAAAAEEMGDLLFSVVNLARFRQLDPEQVMLAATAKFESRFGQMEQLLAAQGHSLPTATATQMDAAWELAKRQS